MDRTAMVFAFLLATIAVDLSAQDPTKPTALKVVYFDVSPPLRNTRMKLPAMVDQSWKEGFIPNAISNSTIATNPWEGANDTVIQHQTGRSFQDTLNCNFDGLGNLNNVIPPDTHGDVGPSYYFQLVNYSFAIYSKSGIRILGPLNTSLIWEGMPHNSNNGDGIVLYDEEADRWLISQFSLPSFPSGPFYQMVAVSQTGDPTGSWYRWEFVFGDLPDYPKFGIWPDGYYMSYTRLRSQTLIRDGVGAVAFDRNAMLNGNPELSAIHFTVPSAECSISFLPADCDGPFPVIGTPNYYGYIRNGFLMIREFHADWLNPTASTFGNILSLPISPFSTNTQGGAPQKGSDKLLTLLDDRLMYRLQYRKFKSYQSMVVNHTVGVDSHSGIRWYELRKTNGNWFINQQSTYSPDTLSRWMGSIAQDSAGNIALGYSVSGSSIFPSIRFTGRMNHDPRGVMTIRETTIHDGTGSQTGIWSGQSRWGDYSSMTVDPVSPSTFWYTQEYYATTSFNGWKTRIASFSFANILDIEAIAEPPAICTGGAAQLDVHVLGGSGACSYAWTSDPAGFTSDLKNPSISPVIPTTYIVQVTSGIQVKTDSVVVPLIPGSTAFAGNDTSICSYISELTLEGYVTNCNTLGWTSSGDGYFTRPDALNSVYRLGSIDKVSDNILLKLTAYPEAPCLPVSATCTIVIDTCMGVNDGKQNSFTLNLYPNPVSNSLTIKIENISELPLHVGISNPLATTLYSETIDNHSYNVTRNVDVSWFAKGIYLLRVQTKTRNISSSFVVQ